jgi:hypothetical protein
MIQPGCFWHLDAQANVKDRSGCTPMHLAITCGSVEMIKILWGQADLEDKNNFGYDVWNFASGKSDVEEALVHPLYQPFMEVANGAFSQEEEAVAIKCLKDSDLQLLRDMPTCFVSGTEMESAF